MVLVIFRYQSRQGKGKKSAVPSSFDGQNLPGMCGSADAAALLSLIQNNAVLQSSAYTGGIGEFPCFILSHL